MDTQSGDYDAPVKSEGDPQFVKFWLDNIEHSSEREKHWRDTAASAVRAYRGHDSEAPAGETPDEFNIFHANVETKLPAIFNTKPVPDVRRRFNDRDPVAKTVSQLLERCISYSIDSYDFMGLMQSVLFDGEVPGRGMARVRYVPYMREQAEPVEGEEPQQPEMEYEEAVCEYVPWSRFRIGVADTWEDVPWIAFQHYLTKEDVEQLAGKKAADTIQMDACAVGIKPDDAHEFAKMPDIYKRATVWEIWDKDTRRVIFVSEGYKAGPLLVEDDPLGLTKFFPTPRPYQPILTTCDLTPVSPYSIYKSLVDELNTVQKRIKALTGMIRAKGAYPAGADDLQRLAEAGDGELVDLNGAHLAADGAFDKMVIWWPIETMAKVLAIIVQQREQIKQTIYEVTGLSDIVRGASKASETATAQELKAQWGSQRIQRSQSDVQRFARDLFDIKAEIVATKFSPETVMMISGVELMPADQMQAAQEAAQSGQPLPPQVQEALKNPPLEEVFGLMQSDSMRSFKVDIESDSTIRADMTRWQKQMSDFLTGTANYIKAVGPAVQSGQMPPQIATEIYAAFARHYKLGKAAEDALDQMSEAAAKPQPPKPDPEMEKAKQQAALDQKKQEADAQAEQARIAADAQANAAKAEQDAIKMDAEMQAKERAAERDFALQQQKLANEFELSRDQALREHELAVWRTEQEINLKREVADSQADIAAKKAAQQPKQKVAAK